MDNVQPQPKKWLLVARVIAGWFASVCLLGFLWFPFDAKDVVGNAYFIATFVALTVFAVVPRKFVLQFRIPVALISVAAIVLSVPLLAQDLASPGGADYFPLVLRLLICALLIILSIEAFTEKRVAV
jgi:hypothetical protein